MLHVMTASIWKKKSRFAKPSQAPELALDGGAIITQGEFEWGWLTWVQLFHILTVWFINIYNWARDMKLRLDQLFYLVDIHSKLFLCNVVEDTCLIMGNTNEASRTVTENRSVTKFLNMSSSRKIHQNKVTNE